ncbi:MAG: glycosyltransferase family 39 protein [Proteobacteria bacterium]|nr:glycosyltransferase family 39 protein [Pseudomonadota bacterium]
MSQARTKTDFTLWYVLYLCALAARTLYFFGISTHHFLVKYVYFGMQASQGHDLGTRVLDLSPLYLAFWTAWVRIFGVRQLPVEALQLFVGTVNCLLLFAVGKRFFGKRTAFAGALLYALYGNVIILEALFEPFVWVVFFGLGCILFLERTSGESGRAGLNALLAGLAGGLAVLAKPNFLPFVALGFLWLAVIHENPAPRRRIRIALVFVLAAALPVSTVTVRNALRFHEFILVTSDFGKVFYHGNGPGAGQPFMAPDPAMEEIGPPPPDPDSLHEMYRRLASAREGRPLSPGESSRYWTGQALSHMASSPTKALGVLAKKALFFFHGYETHLVASAYGEYKRSLSWPLVRFGIIAALGALGMILLAGRWRALFPLYGLVGVYFLSAVILMPTSRYRAPAAWVFCLFAAGGGAWMVRALREKRTAALIMALLAAGALLAAFTWPGKQDIADFEQYCEWPLTSIDPRDFLPPEIPGAADGPIPKTPGPPAPVGIPGPGP